MLPEDGMHDYECFNTTQSCLVWWTAGWLPRPWQQAARVLLPGAGVYGKQCGFIVFLSIPIVFECELSCGNAVACCAMFGVLGTSQNQSCRRKTCFRGLPMSGNIHVKNQTQRVWWMLSLLFGAGFFLAAALAVSSWHNACTKCWNSTHNFIVNMPSLWLGDSGFWTSAVEICRNHLTNSTYPAYFCLATCWCGFSRHGNRSTKKGKCVVTRVAVRVNKVTWTSCNSMWRKYFTNCHFGRLLLSGCHIQQCLPETVLI